MKQIMIDLETMGHGYDAAITAIGAVEFSLDTYLKDPSSGGIVYENNIRRSFYRVVDLNSSVREGGTMDASTVIWWMKQSEEARKMFEEPSVDIKKALKDFSEWIGTKLESDVWGNGATFDLVILESAYQRSGIAVPWGHRNERCYRTMNNTVGAEIPSPERGTSLHNALEDAMSQAQHLVYMCFVKGVKL